MLRSISLLLILFFISSVHAQSLEIPPQPEEPGIDLDLSTFDRFGDDLFWPKGPDQGDYQVSVISFPNPPQIVGKTIQVGLNSFNGGTALNIADLEDAYMTVWYSVTIPIMLDLFGKDLNAGAFVTCETTDGKSEKFFGGNSRSLKVESNEQYPGSIEIHCYMGNGYRAEITISKIRVLPKLNVLVSALNLDGSDQCGDDVSTNSEKCQFGKIKNGDTLSIPFGSNLKFTLFNNDYEIIPAKFELIGNSLAFQGAIESYSLFPSQLAVLFTQDSEKNSQNLITVHLGHQKVKVTPVDTAITPFTIILNSVSSETIGTSNNIYDSLIISRAHQVGIPPQFIKGQVEQESGAKFDPSAYRYEPITIDMMLIQPKILQTNSSYFFDSDEGYGKESKLYGKYLFRPKDRLSTDLDLINKRSLYIVRFRNGTPAVPIDYEITVKKNAYTPLYIFDLLISNAGQNWNKANNYKNYFDDSGDKIAQTIISSSYGLMQIMYTTAIQMGYVEAGVGKDPALLLDPEINLNLATKYLINCINKVNEYQESGPNPQMGINDLNLYIQFGYAGYNKGLKRSLASEPDYNRKYRDPVLEKVKNYPIFLNKQVFSEGL